MVALKLYVYFFIAEAAYITFRLYHHTNIYTWLHGLFFKISKYDWIWGHSMICLERLNVSVVLKEFFYV